jgi:hypothetical protein
MSVFFSVFVIVTDNDYLECFEFYYITLAGICLHSISWGVFCAGARLVRFLFIFIFCARALTCFRPLWASIFSLLIQRKVTKRKDTQHARPAGSL